MNTKRGRPAEAPLASDDQVGSIKGVAARLGVSRTWLAGVKRRQHALGQMTWAEGKVPALPANTFACNKTCATRVREFIRHPINAEFSGDQSDRGAARLAGAIKGGNRAGMGLWCGIAARLSAPRGD